MLTTQNQTPTVNIPKTENSLPYTISIERNSLSMPAVQNIPDTTFVAGLQSFCHASYDGKIVFIAGKTTGLHGIHDGDDTFPALEFNRIVYVIDMDKGTIKYRSLADPSANLSNEQIQTLSPTVAGFFQTDDTLFIYGGYGTKGTIIQYETKKTITSIRLSKLIEWVEGDFSDLSTSFKNLTDPFIQITGAETIVSTKHRPIQISLGQNFEGRYTTLVEGKYTEQIRNFYITNSKGKNILLKETPENKQSAYRRRDLNTIPIISKKDNRLSMEGIALSGIFTTSGGAWTVPIFINEDGSSFMPDPNDPSTFKQGMNVYTCANFGMYSKEREEMFILLFGGISFLYYEEGEWKQDFLLPFDGRVSTITIDKNKKMDQYLMNGQFPNITYPNLTTPSFFGCNAAFIPVEKNLFPNNILSFDTLKQGEKTLIGYIFGGIQSSARNTGGAPGTTQASPYIFNVFVTKK